MLNRPKKSLDSVINLLNLTEILSVPALTITLLTLGITSLVKSQTLEFNQSFTWRELWLIPYSLNQLPSMKMK